jgi:hypothetical protein
MTALPIYASSSTTRLAQFFHDTRRGSPLLWMSAWLMLAGFVTCSLLSLLDAREIMGVSVWEKPGKFFLSLAVHAFTVAWAMSLLPLHANSTRIASWIVFVSSWLELAYITIRAARGEASHFNTAAPIDALLYSLMGIGAVSITLASAVIGYALWRQRRSGLWQEAAGLGLMLGAVLATITAGYLSSQAGHWVGGDQTDATGLAFLNWSTTGGDLRVAHFIGLHASQVVPFAALASDRRIVYCAAVLTTILTALTFAQAVAGMPLLRV